MTARGPGKLPIKDPTADVRVGTRRPLTLTSRAAAKTSNVPAAAVSALPYFWTVDLESPGLFAGLAAEVTALPGVVAVQHVAPS